MLHLTFIGGSQIEIAIRLCVSRSKFWRSLETSGPRAISRWRSKLARGEPKQEQRSTRRVLCHRLAQVEEKKPTKENKQGHGRRWAYRKNKGGDLLRNRTVLHDAKAKE